MAKAKKQQSKKKAASSKRKKVVIPTRDDDSTKVTGKQNQKGKLAHTFPTETAKGKKLRTPFAGGGMVTFRFKKKSYQANEKDAIRVLQYYKHHIATWQVVKAWYVKGQIKNTLSNGGLYKDRKKSQGWAGKGKVVGYSTGKGPNVINPVVLNRQYRDTQTSVKAAISGQKGEYGQNLAIIYDPAPFTMRGNPLEFEINVFFTKSGLKFYKSQQLLLLR